MAVSNECGTTPAGRYANDDDRALGQRHAPGPRAAGGGRRVDTARAGTRSSGSTPTGSTGWLTAWPATRTTPRTSPRRRSSGCSARSRPTSRARSRAGCTGSPPTSSSTWSAAAPGSGWRACPRTPTGCPAAGPSPEQVFSETHLDPTLQAALHELAPEFRAAVVLCDVEGLSYEEIGATLGVKLGTVRSRIHRGRAALRAALERRAEQAPGGGGRRMTGLRVGASSWCRPDWGQDHLASDAVVAFVDDELAGGARARAADHLAPAGSARPRWSRSARPARRSARPADPRCPRRCCTRCARSRRPPSCPARPAGLAMTADGALVARPAPAGAALAGGTAARGLGWAPAPRCPASRSARSRSGAPWRRSSPTRRMPGRARRARRIRCSARRPGPPTPSVGTPVTAGSSRPARSWEHLDAMPRCSCRPSPAGRLRGLHRRSAQRCHRVRRGSRVGSGLRHETSPATATTGAGDGEDARDRNRRAWAPARSSGPPSTPPRGGVRPPGRGRRAGSPGANRGPPRPRARRSPRPRRPPWPAHSAARPEGRVAAAPARAQRGRRRSVHDAVLAATAAERGPVARPGQRRRARPATGRGDRTGRGPRGGGRPAEPARGAVRPARAPAGAGAARAGRAADRRAPAGSSGGSPPRAPPS